MRRVSDVAVSALLLAIAFPAMAVIAAAILWDDGAPFLFGQPRIGRFRRQFTILKFRSMRKAGGGVEITSSGDPRVTRVGRFLRRYKLDELPQLWNVLRGDMSLVGPRPEVPRYVDPNEPAWSEVHRVRPGITDLATLVYRDEERILAGFGDPEQGYREVVLPAKLLLNLEYLRCRSVLRDLKLLALTIRYSFWPAGFNARSVMESILHRKA